MSAKSKLQELLQKCHLDTPAYRVEESTGPSHSPSFISSVTVTLHSRSLVQRGEGRRKKEAENDAATKMLQLLKDFRLEDDGTGLGEVPMGSAKKDLRTLLDLYCLPVAVYTPLHTRGPSHLPTFTVKSEIFGPEQLLLWVGNGDGKTKKEAENMAAHDGLEYMRKAMDSGMLFPNAKPKITPPELSSLRLEGSESNDMEITAQLSRFHPDYVFDESDESDGGVEWLCMAMVPAGGGIGYPIAAHGQGDSHAAAQREASLNLLHNIYSLFPAAFASFIA